MRSLPRAPTNAHYWESKPTPIHQRDWHHYQLRHTLPQNMHVTMKRKVRVTKIYESVSRKWQWSLGGLMYRSILNKIYMHFYLLKSSYVSQTYIN